MKTMTFRGRKLNINLENAIQEAMNELDKATSQTSEDMNIPPMANHSMDAGPDEPVAEETVAINNMTQMVDGNDNTKLSGIGLAAKIGKLNKQNKKRKPRTKVDH